MRMLYKKLFGLDFRVRALETRDLPVYITARREFLQFTRSEIEFILVRLAVDERFGALALEKQAALISSRYGMPVAFGFTDMSRTQRDSLIDRNIAFISDSGQLYLPFLGISLHDRFVRKKEINNEKMMPVTQMLFLFLLYRSKGRSVMKKEAAEALGVTRTSITRASEQLSSMGLITQVRDGRECRMSVECEGRELFEKAKPFLINPIHKVITVEDDGSHEGMPLSGESAIAEKTMLNDPRIPTRAAEKSAVKEEELTVLDTRWSLGKKMMRLELWKYDPVAFARDGVVDPVSLAMSIGDGADERIENELERYLEEYPW